MKKQTFLLVLATLLLASCSKQNNAVLLDVPAFVEQVRNDPNTLIIDVRNPDEYAISHIQGAVNVNIHSNSFAADFKALEKDRPIVLYCTSGSRSNKAAGILIEEGFTQVYDLAGGIVAFKANGYAVQESPSRLKAASMTLVEYNAIVDSTDLVLMDFTATWCGPCQAMKPYLQKLEKEYGDALRVIPVDIDVNPDLANHFVVTGVPTLKLYKKGELVFDEAGGRNEMQLRQIIEPHL